MDLIGKSLLTLFGIICLLGVRYADKVFDRSNWLTGEYTELADIADDEGNFLPGIKLVVYLWIPFLLVAMWIDLSGWLVFGFLAFLILGFRCYSAFSGR